MSPHLVTAKATKFKRDLFQALRQHAFAPSGGAMRFSGDDTVTLVGVQKGFGERWFINVGFWLCRLGTLEFNRIEETHVYFRIERLFPEHRDVILCAGDISDTGQDEAFRALLFLLDNEIAIKLKSLGTEQGLVEAYRAGRLKHGLVTVAARQVLSGT
jgi:hypothetical protein